MKITWLGQAGLLMETEHCRVMVAPYLSSGVEKINQKNLLCPFSAYVCCLGCFVNGNISKRRRT
jgi:hypothetical protein